MGLIPLLLKNHQITKWVNHRNLYLLGLATLACGLGWSNVLMSIGQFIILGNWIIEFGFQQKARLLYSNKMLWLLLSLYLLHLTGLLWSSDFNYAFKDLRVKLPLLLLPLVIGTTEKLNRKEFFLIAQIYTVTLVLLTLTSLGKYFGWWGEPILDKRQLSIYISHIRYGLNLAIGISILTLLKPFKNSNINYTISFWFAICLVLFQLYSGLIFLLIIGVIYTINKIIVTVKKDSLREIILLSITGIFIFTGYQFYSIYKDFKSVPIIDFDQNDVANKRTKGGELYWSDVKDSRKENGIYVRRFIAWKEIEKAWNKRSSMEFWSPDLKGQTLDQTLNRFLSSKGLKKDSSTVAQLSNEEIKAIEKGIANVYYLNHNSVQNRIHKTYFELSEYHKTGDANGFSMALRLEYWKTAVKIIHDNFILGVGTGDVKQAFQAKYEEVNSLLTDKYRNRAHNQYLTFFVTFGIIGFLLFILFLTLPLFSKLPNRPFYLAFWAIMALSFLTEDTLETQAGVTLIAFFNSLFLVGIKNLQIDK